MMSKIFILIALATLSAPVSADPDSVSANDNARPQATDTAQFGLNGVAAECDPANSVCSEAFMGRRINLDGWIWASTERRRKRFASLTRHEHDAACSTEVAST